MNQHPDRMKTVLHEVLQFVAEQRNCFVKNPGKDFIRSRTYDFDTLLRSILSFGANTLNTEIQNFFACQDCPTNSALIQSCFMDIGSSPLTAVRLRCHTILQNLKISEQRNITTICI